MDEERWKVAVQGLSSSSIQDTNLRRGSPQLFGEASIQNRRLVGNSNLRLSCSLGEATPLLIQKKWYCLRAPVNGRWRPGNVDYR